MEDPGISGARNVAPMPSKQALSHRSDTGERHNESKRVQVESKENHMSKFILSAVGIGILALAGAASADQDAPRRASMQGRQVVWQAPQAEKPHALTGERDAAAEKDQHGLRPQGRSGFVRR